MFTNENQVFISLIAIAIVVASIVVLFISGMVRQYRRYSEMQESLNRKRLLELEAERATLARRLREEYLPVLVGTRYTLGEVETNTEKGTRFLEAARQELETVLGTLRDLGNSLYPAAIEEMGPLHALKEWVETLLPPPALEIDIIPTEFNGLSREQSLHLYRMLVEITRNAIKHSGAGRLVISGEQDDAKIVLRAVDDGKGFNLEEARARRSLGLDDLELRASIVGAELLIETAEGKGTSYTINLPVRK